MTTLLRFFRTWAIAPVATYKMAKRDNVSSPMSYAMTMAVAFPFLLLVGQIKLSDAEKHLDQALSLKPR